MMFPWQQLMLSVVVIVQQSICTLNPQCCKNSLAYIYMYSLTMSCIHMKQVGTDDVITFEQSDLCTALNRSSVFG